MNSLPLAEIAWLTFGFLAQFCFAMRFLVQWWQSERAGASIVPVSFWYLSLLGGTMMLVYAIYRMDPVFILGQAMGLIVYLRNLMLIRGHPNAQGRNL